MIITFHASYEIMVHYVYFLFQMYSNSLLRIFPNGCKLHNTTQASKHLTLSLLLYHLFFVRHLHPYIYNRPLTGKMDIPMKLYLLVIPDPHRHAQLSSTQNIGKLLIPQIDRMNMNSSDSSCKFSVKSINPISVSISASSIKDLYH